MASEVSWKDKYLREIDQSERREKQWRAERNVLERLLVRTSLASEGQSEQLDELLAQLREDLRKHNVDVEAWRKLQEEIDRQITLLDEDAPTENHREGAAKPADMELAGEDGQRLRIARRVGLLLGQLLRQVSLDMDSESRARELQKTLMSSDEWPVLSEGLNRVADLVIETVVRNQREFEIFLKRLDERLELLRTHFSEQCDAVASQQDDSATLDREIREELRQVSQDIAESQDLPELKTSVTRRLEVIDDAMERFRLREAGREQCMSKQMEAMQEKLAAMEAHSESMKTQLRQERERAMTDLLTHLPNREAWQERLLFESERWQRYQHPLTVAVLDIDLFKAVNDSYGHKAGDRVLQLMARELRNRLRSTDFVARYGGEEFVLLLPEATREEAYEVIEKLREHVSKLPFHFGGQPVSITFSAGLTAYRDGDTEDSVFDRADRALYQAKDAGRNCTAMD